MWVSMAKEVDAGEVVVSSFRAGMKREFAMMMKAQSEMGGELSMGRRRVTRSQNTGSSGKDNVGSCGKRMKKEDGEKSGRKDMRKVDDEADSGLVDVGIDLEGDLRSLESEKVGEGRNEGGDMVPDSKEGSVHPLCTESRAGGPVLSGGTGTPTSHLSKSKKVELKKVPTKLRDLLEIGLLEGLPVCYIRGSKAREQPDSELRGFIRGTGILCYCEECKGEKVVTPNQFELHAGSGNKRPPEYIYLENGKNLRDVLNACKVEHSDSLEVVIRNFIGRADLRPPAPIYYESALNTGSSGKDNVGSCGKRMKKEDGKKSGRKDMRKVDDEPESGLVDVGIDVGGDWRSLESEKVGEWRNEGGDMVPVSKEGSVHPLCTESGAGGPVLSGGTGTSTSHLSKSKKVELKKVPTKLRDLLEIGLLEGLPVRYVRGSKAREQPDSELRGFIRGTGILCSCEECKGEKVLTPNQFELHAGSGNKRPPEHIYLENGKNLRDVLNACKVEHSDSLEVVIRNFIGRADLRPPTSCLKCKGLIRDISGKKSMLLCGACAGPKEYDSCPTQMSEATYRDPFSGVSSPVASCSQPEVSRSVRMPSKSQSRSKTQKLTQIDLGMHKVVFTDNVLEDGTNLSYIVQGEKRLEGYKEKGGIFCFCCKKVVSPSQFESHAGFAFRRKPYDKIFTSDGASLHEISLGLSTLRKSSSKGNDYLCSMCKEGGKLLCCDNCPRAFHLECVSLSSIPQEKWYCKYCENMFQKAKVANLNAKAIAAGRVAGVSETAMHSNSWNT